MTEFDKKYKVLVKEIMANGIEEYNERTKHKTKAIFGYQYDFDLGKGFPLLTLRRIPIKLFVAETIWYISGSNKPEHFLNKHTPIWKSFTEKDGTVAAAYGHRWRKHFDRDQLKQLVEHLKEQPHSRHGVVMMWDPREDGLKCKCGKAIDKKNVPCPFSFVVNIIKNKLYLHLFIRSNDVMLGGPHDVAGFALLSYILAAKLKVKPGKLVVSISNAHIYDIHYKQAKELLCRRSNSKEIKFKAKEDYFDRAEKQDDTLVEEIVNILEKQYKPQDKLEGLKIVL